MTTHGDDCPRKGKWYVRKECREFSTDGTAMGAATAHMMGTDDPEEVRRIGIEELRGMAKRGLTGMDEEQADWDEGEE